MPFNCRYSIRLGVTSCRFSLIAPEENSPRLRVVRTGEEMEGLAVQSLTQGDVKDGRASHRPPSCRRGARPTMLRRRVGRESSRRQQRPMPLRVSSQRWRNSTSWWRMARWGLVSWTTAAWAVMSRQRTVGRPPRDMAPLQWRMDSRVDDIEYSEGRAREGDPGVSGVGPCVRVPASTRAYR